MILFLLTFVFMVIVIAGMAIGVLLGRESIKGTCGGMGNGSCLCIKKCEKKRKLELLSYDNTN